MNLVRTEDKRRIWNGIKDRCSGFARWKGLYTELNQMPGYKRMGSDMQKTLLELNMADDYYKARKRISELEADLEDKDKAEYDLKHELISAQIQLDESTKKIDQLKDEINELQKQIVKLEAKAERQND